MAFAKDLLHILGRWKHWRTSKTDQRCICFDPGLEFYVEE